MSRSMSSVTSANGKAGTRSNATLLQRQNTSPQICVQRDANRKGVSSQAPSLVRQAVQSPGRPLDTNTRSQMESSLGHDFSQVRVHTDDGAAKSANAVGANAYAAGNHIAFGSGQYSPSSAIGRTTLAHELSHVVQQSKGPYLEPTSVET